MTGQEVSRGSNGVTPLLTDTNDEPEEAALLAEELIAAFAIVLDELTPPQRVALVLHDAFDVAFDAIAHILDTTTASAKKFASRARSRNGGSVRTGVFFVGAIVAHIRAHVFYNLAFPGLYLALKLGSLALAISK